MASVLLRARTGGHKQGIMSRFTFIGLALFFVSFVVVRADVPTASPNLTGEQSHREEAERLWEQAIAAKGGRERLRSIDNLQLSIREKQWWGLERKPYIIETLYVFPGKSWDWADQRGTIFGLVIEMHNYERDIHWGYSDRGKGSSLAPIREGFRGGMSAFVSFQLNYLMETRWVKPVPVSVERGKVGGREVDIVHTVVKEYPKGEERVSFALDRKTHLPRQVIYHTSTFGREYSGGVPLSDYAEINGIQMPTRVYGYKTSYQFNVEYDERVFERPPSVEAGVDAWKKR
jgi:hypothetical protein